MAIEELKALVPEQKNDTITPNAFLQIALAVVVEKHRTTAAHGEYQQRRNGGARGVPTKAEWRRTRNTNKGEKVLRNCYRFLLGGVI